MVVSGRHLKADQTLCPDCGTKVWPWGQAGKWPVEVVLVARALRSDLPASKRTAMGCPHQLGQERGWVLERALLGDVFVSPRQMQYVCVQRDSLFLQWQPCSHFQCPKTLSNTRLHEYFHWNERDSPSA